MKLKLLVIFSFSSFLLTSQIKLTGIITDADTNEPVPYVNIGIMKKDKGTVSTNEGNFEFEIPLNLSNDTLKLTSIGYISKTVLVKDFEAMLKTNPVIQLLPKITELNEVVVKNKRLKEKIVGNKTKSGKFRGGFRNATLGHEVGIKIRIKDSPTYIKKFHANVTSNTSETMKFRMNFYNIKNGLPDKKIIQENIIFSINVKEGEFSLDLAKYNIILVEDFYCTIELIENQKAEDEVFFSAGFMGKTMAYRLTSQGEWDKSGAIGVGFSFTVKY